MPVQVWTAGQVLTAAELTTVTNLLPYPLVVTASTNPCVAGTLYRCQPTGGAQLTMTLPSPTIGSAIGFKLDATIANGSVLVQHNAAELIYGANPAGASRGVTSVTLYAPDTLLVLISDGTNWHVQTRVGGVPLFAVGNTVVGGAPPAGTIFLDQDGYATGTTNAGGALAITFPVPFPNGVVRVVSVTGPAGGDRSVITAVTLTNFSLYYPANLNAAVGALWNARGW